MVQAGDSDAETRRPLVLFGRNVRRLRRNAELTHEELAERSGIDRTTIGKVERGERELGVTRAWRLAQSLGTTDEALMLPPESV